MKNEEAKTALILMYADWAKARYDGDAQQTNYAEAVATAISALEKVGDGDG